MRHLFLNVLAASSMLAAVPALAGGDGHHLPEHKWGFQNIRNGWDKATLMRGAEVATQVCMSCHSLKYIAPRNFMDVGFTEAEAAAIADALGIKMNAPLKSQLDDETAKETYGKPVPDLSVMNKARHGGADYVYALLTGYKDAPAGFEGANYNPVFPGGNIAMPAPLSEGAVTYSDGTEATVDQMARDVAYFMQWAAEPELMERKGLGMYVLIYLVLFAVLTGLVKKRVWKKVKH